MTVTKWSTHEEFAVAKRLLICGILCALSGGLWPGPADACDMHGELDQSVNYTVQESDREWREPDQRLDVRVVGRTEPSGVVVFSSHMQWILRDPGTSAHFYGVGAGGSRFVAVGAGGMIHTSTNGVSWPATASGVSDLLLNVSGDGSGFVVVGDGGRILTSPDGLTWTLRTSPTTQLLRGIAYGNGIYVACGADGTILRSTDGVTWNAVTSGTSEVLQGVAYGGGQFVVVGASGVLLTSPDGAAWTPRSSGTGAWLLDVVHGNGLYIAVGLGGVMRTSVDGVTWTAGNSATSEHLYRVSYDDGQFVAVGANGTILSSSDGTTWEAESSGVATDVRGVIPKDGVFAAVGFEGRILTRHPIEDDPLPGDIDTPATQPVGALSNIVIFTSAGHGFTYMESGDHWRTQRPLLHGMVEDMGTVDQMNLFAEYAFRAGATVVPFRPLGYQTHEVVLDNGDPGVTFGGIWHDSVSPIYYGNPDELPYRYAYINATGTTSWVVFRPNIPEAGFYPVYAWTRHGSDRVRQLYRVYHSGGVTDVRINHRRVGNGWVWLGTYHFDAGTAGSVNISNYAPGENPGSHVIIADAIRFGNGMGDVPRGAAGISGFERELEASRYWVQRMVGQGMSSALYDNPSLSDQNDNVGAPARMAAEMNRETDGGFWDRIYVGFHSNADGGAGTARGPMGLWDTRGTTQKQELQQEYGNLMANEMHADMTWAAGAGYFLDSYANNSANLYGSAYGEIYGTINDQMNSTIIETLFHNNQTDANLLKDPVARRVMARSSYKAIVKHLNAHNAAVPVVLLPDPPTAISVVNSGPGALTLRWTPPLAIPASGDPPTGYVIYRSSNGYGFGNPVEVAGGATTHATLTNMAVGETVYFHVVAKNSGGESLPSTVVGARVAPNGQARHLVVNGFERNDRTQTPVRYFAHALNGNVALVRPRRINAFDYVIQHGEALAQAGRYFDSCDNTALQSSEVELTDYFAAYWILGRESTRNETFNSAEQGLVTAFLQQGGRLFVSGTDLAWDLDWLGSAGDRAFLTNYLAVAYAADDAGTFWVTPHSGGLFDGLPSFLFDNGDGPTYRAAFPDVYFTRGGSVSTLVYGQSSGGTQIAGVTYDGDWKSVILGFPFETILDEEVRHAFMVRVADDFFGPDPLDELPPAAPAALAAEDIEYTSFAARWQASAGATNYLLDVSMSPTFTAGDADYVITFESDSSGSKGAYASGTVDLSGYDWDMTEALIGSLANDWKNGSRSARMRGYGTSSMTMLEDQPDGLGTISFYYRRYGTDAQVDWRVEYSTNGGTTWTQIGGDFAAPASDTVQPFSETVNVSGAIRVRIKRATEEGTADRRLNIDDIVMTPYPSTAFVPGYEARTAGNVTTHTVTGLVAGAEYYYRLRAENGAGVSDYSGVMAVSTPAQEPAYTTTTPVPVPHGWLQQYFGEVEYEAVAMQMTDSGMRVWQEYVAGTDPTDPQSRLAAEVVRSSVSPYNVIQWMGTDQPNRSYTLYWSTNLTGAMSMLQSDIPSAHPSLNIFTDSVNSVHSPIYYRIEVTLDE